MRGRRRNIVAAAGVGLCLAGCGLLQPEQAWDQQTELAASNAAANSEVQDVEPARAHLAALSGRGANRLARRHTAEAQAELECWADALSWRDGTRAAACRDACLETLAVIESVLHDPADLPVAIPPRTARTKTRRAAPEPMARAYVVSLVTLPWEAETIDQAILDARGAEVSVIILAREPAAASHLKDFLADQGVQHVTVRES